MSTEEEPQSIKKRWWFQRITFESFVKIWTAISFIFAIAVPALLTIWRFGPNAQTITPSETTILTLLGALAVFIAVSYSIIKIEVDRKAKKHDELWEKYETLVQESQGLSGFARYINEDGKGSTYELLQHYFDNTKHFDAVSPASIGKNFSGRSVDARIEYYRYITEMVIKRIGKGNPKSGYRYRRIYQTDDTDNVPLLRSYGVIVHNHCKQVLEELGEISEQDAIVFTRHDTNRGIGYLILDDEAVVLIIDGYYKKEVYHASYLYLKHKETVKWFRSHFDWMLARGRPIELEHIRDCQKADFEKMNLTGVDLSNADLTGATLRKANLTNADLKNANMTNVSCDEETILPDKSYYDPSKGPEQFSRFTNPQHAEFWYPQQ